MIGTRWLCLTVVFHRKWSLQSTFCGKLKVLMESEQEVQSNPDSVFLGLSLQSTKWLWLQAGTYDRSCTMVIKEAHLFHFFLNVGMSYVQRKDLLWHMAMEEIWKWGKWNSKPEGFGVNVRKIIHNQVHIIWESIYHHFMGISGMVYYQVYHITIFFGANPMVSQVSDSFPNPPRPHFDTCFLSIVLVNPLLVLKRVINNQLFWLVIKLRV